MELKSPKLELSRADGYTTMLNLDAWTIRDKPETSLIPPQSKSSWNLFDLPSHRIFNLVKGRAMEEEEEEQK